MNKGFVLFLGSARFGEYEKLLSSGYRLGVLLDSSRGASLSNKKAFEWSSYHDFSKGSASTLKAVSGLAEKKKIRVLFNTREAYVRDHALLSAAFGYPIMSSKSIQKITSKGLMRRSFEKVLGNHVMPKSKLVFNEENVLQCLNEMKLPIIIKPNDLAASLFVKKIMSVNQVIPAYRKTLEEVEKYYVQVKRKNPKDMPIQIEEFYQGSVHSIDVIVDGNGNSTPTPTVDVVTGHDIGFEDFHHFIRRAPTSLSEKQQTEASALALKGVKAINMKSCVAHVEFIQTTEGPKLLEIAARPGAHRNRLLEKAFEFSINHQFIEMHLGSQPQVLNKPVSHCAILTPFPREKLIYQNRKAIQQTAHLKTYSNHQVKVKLGDTVGPASEGFYSSLSIELVSKNLMELNQDIERVKQMEFFV